MFLILEHLGGEMWGQLTDNTSSLGAICVCQHGSTLHRKGWTTHGSTPHRKGMTCAGAPRTEKGRATRGSTLHRKGMSCAQEHPHKKGMTRAREHWSTRMATCHILEPKYAAEIHLMASSGLMRELNKAT